MIYQTSDPLASIRKMRERNARCVVYDKYVCMKAILARLNRVADIPAITAQAWTEQGAAAIERWREGHKLLYYRPALDPIAHFPECDALLFIECPLQYDMFEKLAAMVRNEIIIYRPPDWKLHEETVLAKYPTAAYHKSLMAMIEGLRHRELTERMEQALAFSGYDPEHTSVFTAKDAMGMLGMPERQMKSILKYKYRGHYCRFEVYRPMCSPIDDDWKEMYGVLEGEPDLGNGWRMLRFGELGNTNLQVKEHRVPEFKRYLMWMVRKHNVRKEPNIYLLRDGFRKQNYDIVDAIANVRRGNWFKMRNIVDAAPDYSSC